MKYPITLTASDMRAVNRSAILETIRKEGPIARSALADRLGVSLPTVLRIVEDLIREGFVRELGSKEWSGGRRRSRLEFNAEEFVVLGIDLGGTKMYGALSDLGGNLIDEVGIGRHGTSGEDSLERLAALIDTLLAKAQTLGRSVRGIGVGVPGITLHRQGIVRWASTLQWKDFPLKDRLQQRYSLPITVDNDVNLAALGEYWFGAGQNAQNLIVIAIGTGIGAGIILDGGLYRGSQEASGEIGSMIPGCEFLGRDFRDFGALESVASGTGIAERARRLLAVERGMVEGESPSAEEVFDAARQDEPWARKVIDETVEYLAVAVGNLAVSFDPDVIILGGGVARSGDLLIGPILDRLQLAIPTPPRLVASELGVRAAVMGAIANVLHTTSDYYIVHKLS
jgi:glucokinase